MKLPPKTKLLINTILIFIVVTLTYFINFTVYVFEFIGLMQICDQMIFPGMFYYWHHKEQYIKDNVNIQKMVFNFRTKATNSTSNSRLALIEKHKSSVNISESVSNS